MTGLTTAADRLALLGRQSYWGDELFSVDPSAGAFRTMLEIGRRRVPAPPSAPQ